MAASMKEVFLLYRGSRHMRRACFILQRVRRNSQYMYLTTLFWLVTLCVLRLLRPWWPPAPAWGELPLGFSPCGYWPTTRGADSPRCTCVSIAFSFSLISTCKRIVRQDLDWFKRLLNRMSFVTNGQISKAKCNSRPKEFKKSLKIDTPKTLDWAIIWCNQFSKHSKGRW